MNPFDLPGPEFLLFYTIFGAVAIAGLVFWRRRAELLPAPPRVDLADPYLIAYLRGGEQEVRRVATAAGPADASRSRMFEKDGLSKACESYDRTLRRARLLPDAYVTRMRSIRLAVAILLLSGVALFKVLLALAAGRTNVGFLVVLSIAAIVIAFVVSFPRLTESGNAMLEDVKSLYSGLHDRAVLQNAGGAGVEPMMLAAVFGVGALSAPAFAHADPPLPDRKKTSEGSCATEGDCGSSCSSGSSDSSSYGSDSSDSSSCSSGSSCGSSCGGGCGGCGGG